MPPEVQPSKSPPTPDQIKQQLNKLRDDPLMEGRLRYPALRWLIDFKAAHKYDRKPKPRSEEIFSEFYKYAHHTKGIDLPKMPGNIAASGKKLFFQLATALKKYYAEAGAKDSIIITLKGGKGGGYEPQFAWRPAPVPATSPDDLLNAFIGTFHLYHLSENDEDPPQPTWWYKKVDFQPTGSRPTLSGRAFTLPKVGAAREKKNEYDYEISLDCGHLVLLVHRRDGTPDLSVAVF